MTIGGATVLVTGANRGLGRALVEALAQAKAGKIYAAAREPDRIRRAPGIEPVTLDITSEAEVAAAARHCTDVQILINNAGVAGFVPALGAATMETARREMETNYFGTLSMCRAFAPVLRANGGGVLVNILSVVSWFNAPMQGSYSASKAAEWSLTKAARFELRAQGTRVVGVFAGYIDTEMTAGLAQPKSSPEAVAAAIVAGIEDGSEEILADERARSLYPILVKDQRAFDLNMQRTWDEHVREQGDAGSR